MTENGPDVSATELTVVVPVYNERPSLRQLTDEIRENAERTGRPFEIVFVDDGSTDGSWEEILTLAQDDERVRGVKFRRNFGKAAALHAGFARARGRIIVQLDADLQDDPREIPRFLEVLEEGYDLVNGWKRPRRDPWHKVWPSRVFNLLVSLTTGLKLHDHNCGFKCMRAEVARELRLYGDLHRFIPVLAYARGFRVTEMPVHHRPRVYGRSKYGPTRFLKGILDLMTVCFVTGFASRPLHFLGTVGLVAFLVGMIGLIYLAFVWVMHQSGVERFGPIGQRPLLVYSTASLLLGFQMLGIGFLAELFAAFSLTPEAVYSVEEEVSGGLTERQYEANGARSHAERSGDSEQSP